jgi:hypothetical protein
MREIVWRINRVYFQHLAREHYGEFLFISPARFASFLYLWAKENDCVVNSYDSMRCSEDVYMMLKLKGVTGEVEHCMPIQHCMFI